MVSLVARRTLGALLLVLVLCPFGFAQTTYTSPGPPTGITRATTWCG